MPSQISISDIEAFCYSELRCKDPQVMRRFISMLRVWQIQESRKMMPLPDVQVAAVREEPGELQPGESDPALQVTCCVQCLKPKPWKSFRPLGSVLCRACVTHIGRLEKARNPEGELFPCRKCNEKFTAEGFPAGDVTKTCFRCLRIGGYLGKKVYWKCPSCTKMRPSSGFPVIKWRNPRLAVKCESCADET